MTIQVRLPALKGSRLKAAMAADIAWLLRLLIIT
jgi:hypothetical protein